MAFIWDYRLKDIKIKKEAKALELERTINYGVEKGKKIKLAEVKKHWDKINLFPKRKKLFELLLWGKSLSSPKSNKRS